MGYLLVFLGGGLGSAARYGLNRAAALAFAGYPAGTLAVNVVGSVLMGLAAGWFARRGAEGAGLRLFLTTGVLGGFTTFSAFSLDAAVLWQRGDHAGAAVYVVASVGLSLLGVLAGLWLMRAAT